MRIIMRFSRQHKQIRNIIQKHWSILKDDNIVKHFIPPVPSITFKKAASLKDKLVKSEYRKMRKKNTVPHMEHSHVDIVHIVNGLEQKKSLSSRMDKCLNLNTLLTVRLQQ